MKENVYIQHCNSYNQEELSEVLEKTCLEMPDLKNKTVLLKVNILSDAKPEDCITTNPEFVRAVIKLVKTKGAAKILVGDSPGLPSANFCGKNCGIYDVCIQEGAIWVNFAENTVNTKISGTNKEYPIAKEIFDADVVISLPKFKTHQLMYCTGAVKNMFGCIVGLHKSPCHLSYPSRESFASFICKLYQTIKPSYCIMDAVLGMEGPGPANGRPKAVNLVLASPSGFALDYAQATIMGYKTSDIPILKQAEKQGLLPQEIEYPLINAKEVILTNFVRITVKKKCKFFKSLIIPFFTRNSEKAKQKRETPPAFSETQCIHCLKCVNICPAQALSFDKNLNKIHIDYNKCIRCYCCHEMCPANAIEIKGKEEC